MSSDRCLWDEATTPRRVSAAFMSNCQPARVQLYYPLGVNLKKRVPRSWATIHVCEIHAWSVVVKHKRVLFTRGLC